MAYLLVFLASVAVGGTVYVWSLRTSEAEPATVGFEPDETPSEPDAGTGESLAPGYTYLQVLVTRGPSWRQRLTGLVGSLALVVAASAAVAAAVYVLGVAIDRVIRSFVGP